MAKQILFAVTIASILVNIGAAEKDFDTLFESFKAAHGRSYKSVSEESLRKRVFVQNMHKAAALMKSNPLASFGVNLFSDLTAEEFQAYHNGKAHYAAAQKRTATVAALAPKAGDKIDWRTKGAVTPVKNQGQCGSCWSFSTTGNIEGQWFLAGNTLTSLSEQELVSCDTVDHGCNGGLMDNAFNWLLQNRNGNIAKDSSYPYVSGNGQVPACKGAGVTGATITSYHDVTKTEVAMANHMYTHGPIAIAVDATTWQSYTGGVMTDCPSGQLDHGVLAVGYDNSASTPYWLIKNSWTANWGEQGYIRVEKGTNQCSITSYPTSAIVGGTPGPTTSAAPTTPAPGGNSTFTQYVCTNFLCSSGCQSHTLPQNQCLRAGSGSALAECTAGGLKMSAFQTSDCTGASQSETEPVNQCLQDQSGTYIYNVCPSSVKSLRLA